MAGSLQDIQLDIVIRTQGSDSVRAASAAIRGLQGSVDRVTSSSKAMADTNYRQITSWAGLSEHLSKVERNLDAVWRAGVHLKALGGDLVRVSKQIVGTGMQIVDTYADYDFMLRRAAVALNTNTEWQQKLDQAIQDTAVSVGLFKPEEVAKAYYIWGAASGEVVDTQKELVDIQNVVNDVLIATAAAGGSLETNLKGVYGVISQFNMGTEKASYVTRVLAMMTERTAADFGDLINAFSYVGPLANSLGISFEEVAQILGFLADAGQRGSRSGRALSMIIEGLSAPSEKAAGALDDLFKGTEGIGKSFKNVAFPMKNGKRDFVGLEKLVRSFALALYNADDATRGYIYSVAFTNNATRALIPVVERTISLWRKDADARRDQSVAMDQQKYSLENVQEFFHIMTSQMQGSIKGVVGSFQNSFFPILQMIALKIWEYAAPALEFLKERFGDLREFMKDNPELVDLVVKIGAIAAAVIGLAGIVLTAVGSLVLLGAGIAFLVKGFGGIFLSFSVLGGLIGGVIAGITANVGGIRDALTEFLTEIGSLFTPAVDAFKGFRTVIDQVLAAIGPAVEGAFTVAADVIRALTDEVKKLKADPEAVETIGRIAGYIGLVFASLISLRTALGVLGFLTGGLWALARAGDAVKAVFLAFTGIKAATGLLAMFGGVLAGVAGFLGPVGLVILAVVGGIAAAFAAYESNFMGFRDFVDGIALWVQTNVVPVLQGFATTVGTTFNQIVAVVLPLMQRLWAPFQIFIDYGIPKLIELVQGLFDAWVPVFTGLAETIAQTFNEYILPAIQPFIDMIQNSLMPLLGELLEWFILIWNGVVTVVGGALGFIFNLIIEFVTLAAPYVKAFLDGVIMVFGATFGGILQIVSSVLGAIFDVIHGVLTVIRNTIEFFLAILRGDWEGAWKAVQGIVDGVFRVIKGIVGGAINFIASVIDTGLRFISSIFEFIFGMKPGSIYSKIKGFIDTVIQFGKDIVDGIISGIKSMIDGLVNFISGAGGFISNIINGFASLPGKIFDIGKSIVKGIWDGIVSMGKWLFDQLVQWAINMIPGPIRDILGIHSPSRVMAVIGGQIVEGLAQGITASNDALVAMSSYTNALAGIAATGSADITSAFNPALPTGGGLSFSSSNERVIRLQVEVTSPDGSVSSLTAQQIADLIEGGDLASSLEHMASVND